MTSQARLVGGRYEEGEPLGRGGMAEVRKGVDNRLGRTVRDLLRDDRRLLPERALEITDGVLRALDYSHRNGIVHRDIKPANVMVTRTGEITVMDFGIARAVSDAQATMTQTAQVIGTAQYLSPEQARGERVDARSDLYSTGCLLYELLCGRPPFTGDSPVAIAYQHVTESPVPPSRVDPEVPAWADAIVMKSMAKDPAGRYQTAGEMRADIQRGLSGMPVSAPTVGSYQRTQRMGPATMMAAPPGYGRPTSAIPAYQYGPPDEEYEEGGRGRRWWPWVVGLLVVLAAIGAVAYLLLAGTKTYPVPQVQGDPQAKAVSEVKAVHLVPRVVKRSNGAVPSGHVISSSPPFGNLVPARTVVTLYVSTGPKLIPVPNIVGQNVSQAENTLSSKGLHPTVRTNQNSTQPAGTVVKQTPLAGTQVKPGSSVTVVVSGGGVQVPNVIGQSLQVAQAALQADGLNYTVSYVPASGGTAPGTVVGMKPKPGTAVARGRTITLQVAQSQPSTPPTSTSPPPSSSPPSPTPSQSQPGQSQHS